VEAAAAPRRRSAPSPFDWIRDIAASQGGGIFFLNATTYLIDAQYQLPPGTEVYGAGSGKDGTGTVIRAVGLPAQNASECNRKGLVLGDNTVVNGFHFVGVDTRRVCFSAAVETPGCSNNSIRFTTPPTEANCGRHTGGTNGHGVRNATVEDITVEGFTTQTLFMMPPTQAGLRVSQDVTVRRLQSYGTFADGVNIHGQHSNVLVEDCTVRYSGDDSFAIWSIGTGLDNVTFHNNTAMYPHGNGGGKAQGTMGQACAKPCPCDAETWDGLRWCNCPGAPKDAFCRAAGCFAVYGGLSSTFENNTGFECGGGIGLVSFGAKWAAIHGRRELHGLFGGAWNSSSSTRVVGNTIDGAREASRQCSFEAPIDLQTNRSVGRSSFPGSVVCEVQLS